MMEITQMVVPEVQTTNLKTHDCTTLMAMPADQLAQVWRQQLRKSAPSRLPKSLLAKSLAYRIQVEQHGGLSREAISMLEMVAKEQAAGRTGDIAPVQENRIKAGAVLVREHDDEMHRVMVLTEGYAWNGQTFPSLSAVAKAITGTNWNGHTFFGLKIKPRKNYALSTRRAT